MALSDLTKVKDVLDALRPADLSRISESARAGGPAAAGQADNTGATIFGQIQAMQKAVKEDEELVVLLGTGVGMLRVLEIYLPSWPVAVVTGIDTDRALTRVISTVQSLQLICKTLKVPPGGKPTRVNLIVPKSAG